MGRNSSRDWPLIGRRIGYAASFVMVAGVAATVSYTHIRDVARYGHQNGVVAHLLPLAVDGMMLVATLAMAEDKAASRNPRGWARFGFWFGAVISTAANVAATVVEHGWDPLSIGVAALAPILLLLAIEIVARPGKPKGEPAEVVEAKAEPATINPAIVAPSTVATPVPAAIPAAPAPASTPAPVEALDPEAKAPETVAELEVMPEAPVSPAISGTRKPYGPRQGDSYSQRHDRRKRTGK